MFARQCVFSRSSYKNWLSPQLKATLDEAAVCGHFWNLQECQLAVWHLTLRDINAKENIKHIVLTLFGDNQVQHVTLLKDKYTGAKALTENVF